VSRRGGCTVTPGGKGRSRGGKSWAVSVSGRKESERLFRKASEARGARKRFERPPSDLELELQDSSLEGEVRILMS